MKKIGIEEMSIKTAIRVMMEGTEYQQFKEIAETLNIPKSTLQSALDNNSLRVRDFTKIADLLGYKIVLEQKERE